MNLIEQALLDAKIAKGRADKATKEPWVEPDDGNVGSIDAANGTKVTQTLRTSPEDNDKRLANADFIRVARSDVPKLADHVEVLAKRLDVANGHLLGWLYRKAGRVVPGITHDTREHLAICGINVSKIDSALTNLSDDGWVFVGKLSEALRVALDRLECANEIILRDVMCEDDIDGDCAETSTWIVEGRELLAKCDAAVAK